MSASFLEGQPVCISDIIQLIKRNSHRLRTPKELDPLMEKISDAKYVLLGEASHGTHEYYTWRAKITKRLILEKNFSFIAVEGDWPDCYRLNRYVKNYPDAGKSAFDVLHEFNRWPTWMWANWEIVSLAEWLCEHNKTLPLEKRVGFYGLDVYSLSESLEAIMKYLEKTDRHAFESATKAIECFDLYGYEGESYGRSTHLVPESCESEVVNLLKEIRSKITQYNTDHETVFSTEQNAWVAVNAENYYRSMIKDAATSWNIRDKHMAETLNRLTKFHGTKAKAIVWEHNTHIGDARATDMRNEGMFNLGELVTQEHKKQGVIKVGFGSYKGTVIAGRKWSGEMNKMSMPEGIEGSWEYILHKTGNDNKLLLMDKCKNDPLFNQYIGHRAIGVVYNPSLERLGNYVPSILPLRYDAFIFFDETRALHPLHIKPSGHQIPETYPFGV
ncbi:MAG: erythromycin esterase family protein [Bacteroidetes bacterium]|nr:erythromycin esterase family protein [Bacteroidota bacterium]